MSGFKNPEAALSAVRRIDTIALRSSERFLLAAAETSSRPDQAVTNFERWLKATGSPSTMMDAVVQAPEPGRLLVHMLGASHQIADVLVQNPELAHLVLDPAHLGERPTPAGLKREIESALVASTGHTHSLDRLRFIKQGWHLRIAAADLAGAWPEEDVWRALSVVADALTSAAANVVWADVCRQRGHIGECPVSIVAMGKLGGQELNFSSDIDLIYVLDDKADEEVEKLASRFGEALNRALSDRMGRGALYRVDLRLRPYGGRGPLVPKQASVEGYYERYAEPWEHLALVRSCMIVGNQEAEKRWDAMRERTCFQPARGEWVVQSLLDSRARTEAASDEGDLKRGAGGIRDIEFLTQILQLLYGHSHPALQCRPTCTALRALQSEAIITADACRQLEASYVFLRQVEHRIQLLGDQQLHTLPSSDDERSELARRVGFAALAPFDSALAMHRSNARTWYDTVLRPERDRATDREEVLAKSGSSSSAVARWLDAIPAEANYYKSLAENESSLDRVLAITRLAPALVPHLRESVSVTEQVMTGEVMESDGSAPVTHARKGDIEALASAIKRGWLKAACRWVLRQGGDFGAEATGLYDQALVLLSNETALRPVALGSFGGREMSLFSDLDVLLWVDDGVELEPAEAAAQRLLADVQALRRAGGPIELDLRLRPEGRRGRLTVTGQSLEAYAKGSLEPWERLALGRARPLVGDLPRALSDAAFGLPLDSDTLAALKKMKDRVETERVPVQYRRRHVKLGAGGQDDILWLTQLLWWRRAGDVDLANTSVTDRLGALHAVGEVPSDEAERLKRAWDFYLALRMHSALLGMNDEVLPENPDRLASLATSLQLESANEVLATFEAHRVAVRRLFEAALARLGA